MKWLTMSILVCLAGPARAEVFDEYDQPPPPERSPQRFMLEFKLGPYSPDIDATSGLHGTPFADLFNNQFTDRPGHRPGPQPLFTLEFDWQFWHEYGSLGIGASLGFQRRKTHAFEYSPGFGELACTVPNCVRAGDTTALTFFPIELLFIYRFDVLALRYGWKCPFVPYVKAGLAYYFWFIQDGGGDLAESLPRPDGGVMKGIGGTFGLIAQPGIAIMLDALDPRANVVLDTELGINHAYAFFEMNAAWITSFNIGNKMSFSDLTWSAGLGFEF